MQQGQGGKHYLATICDWDTLSLGKPNQSLTIVNILLNKDNFRWVVENNAYGVCNQLGDMMNVSTRSIRFFFIYASFLTLGSPVIVYMILAFWMDMSKHFRRRRSSVWDL